MEQQQLSIPATATLELLEQGGLTTHWDHLMGAIRESVTGITEPQLADTCRQLRSRDMVAFALWIGERVHGYVVMQPVVYQERQAMNVYAIHGNDIDMGQWASFIEQVSDLLRNAGYSRMVAITTNPRVLEIVRRTGWNVRNYCERVL